MRVGVGDQKVAVQHGKAAVHGRVGGEPCFHRADVGGQVPKALLDGVKAGEGTEAPGFGKVSGNLSHSP